MKKNDDYYEGFAVGYAKGAQDGVDAANTEWEYKMGQVWFLEYLVGLWAERFVVPNRKTCEVDITMLSPLSGMFRAGSKNAYRYMWE